MSKRSKGKKIYFKNTLADLNFSFNMIDVSAKFENINEAINMEKVLLDFIYKYEEVLPHIPKIDPIYFETNKKITQLKEQMKQVSSYIVSLINNDHYNYFSIDDLIAMNPDLYYSNGIIEVIKTSEVDKRAYYDLLNKTLPSHPKYDYPKARELKRHFVIHQGETNSGKTHDAIKALKNSNNGIYLTPLRLLANEIFQKLNSEDVRCNLITGEESVSITGAKHYSCTIENGLYDLLFDIAVIDEAQHISKSDRGWAWTKAILGVQAKEIHICTSPIATSIIIQLINDCEDTFEIITHDRKSELLIEDTPFYFPSSAQKGDAFVCFSKKSVIKFASELIDYGVKASLIYGNLPPEARRNQVELFLNGTTDCLVCTDAIGIGLNIPIRRIVFLENEKFDGKRRRQLNTQEIKQISGRAGRYGIYNKGYVNTTLNKDFLYNNLFAKETEVDHAHISPSLDVILNLPFGTLKERLNAWIDHPINIPYLKKQNLKDQLFLLRKIEKFNLDNETLLKLIHIPFNTRNYMLLDLWLTYVSHLKSDKLPIPRPIQPPTSLKNMEIYHQQLDLYYSFNKTLNFDFDNQWINDEKNKISQIIHNLIWLGEIAE